MGHGPCAMCHLPCMFFRAGIVHRGPHPPHSGRLVVVAVVAGVVTWTDVVVVLVVLAIECRAPLVVVAPRVQETSPRCSVGASGSTWRHLDEELVRPGAPAQRRVDALPEQEDCRVVHVTDIDDRCPIRPNIDNRYVQQRLRQPPCTAGRPARPDSEGAWRRKTETESSGAAARFRGHPLHRGVAWSQNWAPTAACEETDSHG